GPRTRRISPPFHHRTQLRAAGAVGVSAFADFLDATVRTATPLALAATGELIVERAGMINIGLEGVILSGAFGAIVGASHGGAALGLLGGMLAGVITATLFLVFVVFADADQIVTGTAVTLFAAGATGALYRAVYGTSGAGLTAKTLARLPIPGLSAI